MSRFSGPPRGLEPFVEILHRVIYGPRVSARPQGGLRALPGHLSVLRPAAGHGGAPLVSALPH